MAAEIIQSTTQQFLDIHDITNNLVIMKDGTVSVIIAVDAMNFGLLAEEEQDAVMYAYAGLLNSLNYTVQIVIHSQTKDVTSYLQLLKDQESEAANETMQRRIRLYREFVSNLIHERNVLDKKFYVVIPANNIELGLLGASTVIPGQNKFDINSVERSVILEKALNILEPRRDHLIAQFARIGLYSRQLSTQEIIQLFYIRYNPEAAEGQQIAESNSYTSPLVQASIQGNFMTNDLNNPTAAMSVPADSAAVQPPTNTEPTTPVAPVVAEPAAPDTSAAPTSPTMPNTASAAVVDAMPNILSQPTAPAASPAVQPTISTSTIDDPTITGAAPVMPEPVAPATPAAPVTTKPSVAPPVVEPVVSAPVMPSPAETAASASTTTAGAPTTAGAVDEAAIQADLDATVKQLGGNIPQVGPSVPPNQPTGDTKTDDLPPLPEI